MMRWMRWLGLSMVLALGCGGPLDVPALQAELDDAEPGEVVELPARELIGAVVVPTGVTLRGVEGSGLAHDDPMGIGIELMPGAGLESITLRSAGRVGIVGRGGARVTDVVVAVERGVGAYFTGGDNQLERVTLSGPVSDPMDPRWVEVSSGPADAAPCAADCACEPGAIDGDLVCDGGRWKTWTATIGLVVDRGAVDVVASTVEGFATHGLVALDATVAASDLEIRDTLGVGALVRGTTASSTMGDLTIRSVSSGLRGVPSTSLVAVDAELRVERGTIEGGDRYGVAVSGAASQVSLMDVDVVDHGDVAIWAVGAGRLLVDGSRVERNAFAGIVVQSTSALVSGTTVADTRSATRSLGMFGSREIGDGVEILDAPDVQLTDVTLRGSARAQLVVDVDPGVTFERVMVEAPADALGALGGAADDDGRVMITQPPGWDSGVSRDAAATSRDAAAGGTMLDAVPPMEPVSAAGARGVIAPMY